MLVCFLRFITQSDPDILIAWNGDRFDFPYIINRFDKCDIGAELLSRIDKAYINEKQSVIKGRILFDIQKGYKKLALGERESYSLNYISWYELKKEKLKFDMDLEDLYINEFDTFLEYNKKDVELMVELDKKLKITEYFDTVRRIAKCQFLDVFSNSKVIDCLLLSFCHNKCVLPTKPEMEKETFKGAKVLKTSPGFYHNVACADIKSLYPFTIISFNLSPETLLKMPTETSVHINNYYFEQKEKGIVPSIIEILVEIREKYQAKMREFEVDSKEYEIYFNLQYAIKRIMNSFYGVIGSVYSRIHSIPIASTITYFGRQLTSFNNDYYNQNGFKVITGDTDSIIFSFEGKSVKEAEEATKKLNENYTSFVKERFGLEKHQLNLEFEKVYKTLLITNAKKKYAGRLIWKGKDCDKLDITGFESVRSDNPQIGRDFLSNVLEMICYEKPQEEVDVYIKKFEKELKNYSAEELAFPITLVRKLETYKNQIHARASRHSNQYHNANIKGGDKIKWIYVERTPFGVANSNVVAFKNGKRMPEGYEIDMKKMCERIIWNKIEKVYEFRGWSISKQNAKIDAWLKIKKR